MPQGMRERCRTPVRCSFAHDGVPARRDGGERDAGAAVLLQRHERRPRQHLLLARGLHGAGAAQHTRAGSGSLSPSSPTKPDRPTTATRGEGGGRRGRQRQRNDRIPISCQSGARTKAADKTHVAVSRPPLREHGGAEVVDAALDDHGQLRVCGVGLERRHDDRDACARHGRARQSASTARGQALCRTQSCCCCSSTCHTSAAAWQPARLQHSVTSATRSEARGRSMRQAAETKRKGRAGGGTRPGRCRARR